MSALPTTKADKVIISSPDYPPIVAQMPNDIGLSVEQNYVDPMELGMDPRMQIGINKLGEFLGRNGPGWSKEFAGYMESFTGQVDFATLQAWQGGSQLNVTIELIFVAETNVEEDIIRPIRDLLKMSTPGVQEVAGARLLQNPTKETQVDVRIGNVLKMEDVYILSVAPTLSYPLLIGGIPSRVPVSVTMSTKRVITKDRVDTIFFDLEAINKPTATEGGES